MPRFIAKSFSSMPAKGSFASAKPDFHLSMHALPPAVPGGKAEADADTVQSVKAHLFLID